MLLKNENPWKTGYCFFWQYCFVFSLYKSYLKKKKKLFCWEKVSVGLCDQQHTGRSDPSSRDDADGRAGWRCHWRCLCPCPAAEMGLMWKGVLHLAALFRDVVGHANWKRCIWWMLFLSWTVLPSSWVCDSGPHSAWGFLLLPAGIGSPQKLWGDFSRISVLHLLFCLGIALEGAR